MTNLPLWPERSLEEANLFNPAFLALIVRQICLSYSATHDSGLPLPLAFIGTPLVLHAHSREVLPYNSRTDLLVWLSGNPDVRFLLPGRVQRLRPFIQEAILFAHRRKIVAIDQSANLKVGSARVIRARVDAMTGTAGVCIHEAEKLGRWMSKSGDLSFQLLAWGVVP